MVKQWWLVFVLLGVDASLGDKCKIWEHLPSFTEVKWGRGFSQRLNLLLCVCFESRELRDRVSPRFPCVTLVIENFYSDFLPAISYWTESHLESCETSAIWLFCENSQQPKGIDYIHKKAQMQLFDWIPNVPPIGKVLYMLGVGRLQMHEIWSRRLMHRETVETWLNYKRTFYVWYSLHRS